MVAAALIGGLPFAGAMAFTQDTANISVTTVAVADVALHDITITPPNGGYTTPTYAGFAGICLATNSASGHLTMTVNSMSVLTGANNGNSDTLPFTATIADATGDNAVPLITINASGVMLDAGPVNLGAAQLVIPNAVTCDGKDRDTQLYISVGDPNGVTGVLYGTGNTVVTPDIYSGTLVVTVAPA